MSTGDTSSDIGFPPYVSYLTKGSGQRFSIVWPQAEQQLQKFVDAINLANSKLPGGSRLPDELSQWWCQSWADELLCHTYCSVASVADVRAMYTFARRLDQLLYLSSPTRNSTYPWNIEFTCYDSDAVKKLGRSGYIEQLNQQNEEQLGLHPVAFPGMMTSLPTNDGRLTSEQFLEWAGFLCKEGMLTTEQKDWLKRVKYYTRLTIRLSPLTSTHGEECTLLGHQLLNRIQECIRKISDDLKISAANIGQNVLFAQSLDEVSGWLVNAEAKAPQLAMAEAKPTAEKYLEGYQHQFKAIPTTTTTATVNVAKDYRDEVSTVDSNEIEEILRSEREQFRANELQQLEKEQLRTRFSDLWKAANAFNCWSAQLQEDLGRRPAKPEERANRFLQLAADLRGVVDRNSFNDFWDMLNPSDEAEELDKSKGYAYKILRHLLSPDATTSDFIKFDHPKLPFYLHLFGNLVQNLAALVQDYDRCCNAPAELTIDDLISLLHMKKNGINLLCRRRPEVVQVRELFGRVYDDFSFDRDWLNGFANGYDDRYPPPNPSARSLPLSDLIERLRGWEQAERDKCEHPPQSANTTSESASEAVIQYEAPKEGYEDSSDIKPRSLYFCEEKAYGEFVLATTALAETLGREPKDEEAYKWLDENKEDGDELAPLNSWKRYVRAGRNFHGTQKNSSRKSRARSKSVVSETQL